MHSYRGEFGITKPAEVDGPAWLTAVLFFNLENNSDDGLANFGQEEVWCCQAIVSQPTSWDMLEVRR